MAERRTKLSEVVVRTAPDESFTTYYRALMKVRSVAMQAAATTSRDGDKELASEMVRVVDQRLSTHGVQRLKGESDG